MSSMKGLAALVCLSAAASAADAQVVGTFRWQTAPFCNVVTLTVTQQPGGVFTLDGFDDQCGASTRAAASGMGVPNPDGTVALGLTIVNAPEASPLHLTVPVNLATLGGTWRDSAGQSGAFLFTPGASRGGARRPSIGTLGPVVLPTTADGAFDFSNPRGLVSRGPEGALLTWLTSREALRAGSFDEPPRDDGSVGRGSVAFGLDSAASGLAAFAVGQGALAAGTSSVAMGFRPQARGDSSFAAGDNSVASGEASVAAGLEASATGAGSVALGFNAIARGSPAVALGLFTVANGTASVALGSRAVANADGSFVFGDRSTNGNVESGLPNQFLVRAAGGTVFWSTRNTTFGTDPGVALFPGASAWAEAGPAAARENARELDGEGVLGQIALMPVRTWNYKAQAATIRHAGPTAEDFHAAFGLGEDPRYITTTDAAGIGFAAIQALEARTRTLSETDDVLRRENGSLRRENETLRQMLAALVDRLDRIERLATERLTADERK